MSELIGIVGESGTGKSTALRTLDPKETLIISCIGKPVPIPGWKKDYKPFKGKEGNFFVSDIDMIYDDNYIQSVMDFITDNPIIRFLLAFLFCSSLSNCA